MRDNAARIPAEGLSRDAVFSALEAFRKDDIDWRSGRTWAYVYDAGEDAEHVAKKAFADFLSENALDPTVFPSAMRLEVEVVEMMARHVGAPDGAVGNFTSGGTESIFCAIKAARDSWAEEHPALARSQRAQIVLPITAHASFHKAAHLFGMEVVLTGVDDQFRADPQAIADAITERTCLTVGSAVSYAHGVVDPIPELGQIALDKGVRLHVDACIGGFLLPYFRRLGGEFCDWNLEVPGVSSLSVDMHKYAFAPKGASCVLYRDASLRKHQFYAGANWTGYTVINTTMQSSKSVGPIAAAWAVMNYIGDKRYLEMARVMRDTTQALCDAVEAMPGLTLLARPDTNLVAVGSDEVSVFHVADEMRTRGWYVQPQLAYRSEIGESEENIHFSVNPKGQHWLPSMLEDLATSVEAARTLPTEELGEMVGMLEGLDLSQVDSAAFQQLLGMVGIEGVELPERMADVNALLNALPVELRQFMLVEFLNELYQPRD